MHKVPKGVIKIVRRLDSLERGICQNPLLPFSLEKIFEFTSAAKLSSTEDTGLVRTGPLCSDVSGQCLF